MKTITKKTTITTERGTVVDMTVTAPKKCKECLVYKYATEVMGCGKLFVCKGKANEAFCKLHYEKAD